MFRKGNKIGDRLEGSLYSNEEPANVSTYKFEGKKPPQSEAPLRFDLPSPHSFEKKTVSQPIYSQEEPETTIGEGVTFRGELTFERCLRIDGNFEGKLISKGKIIVGPKGRVKADIHLNEAVIEGRIEGNIIVDERLELRGEAQIIGDITSKLLMIDEGVTLIGFVQVNPANQESENDTLFAGNKN